MRGARRTVVVRTNMSPHAAMRQTRSRDDTRPFGQTCFRAMTTQSAVCRLRLLEFAEVSEVFQGAKERLAEIVAADGAPAVFGRCEPHENFAVTIHGIGRALSYPGENHVCVATKCAYLDKVLKHFTCDRQLLLNMGRRGLEGYPESRSRQEVR